MSLRARILALFLGLGVVPMLLLGVLGYARSKAAVRGLLEDQTAAICRQIATEIRDRYELRLSELLLLAENAQTQQLYRTYASRTALPRDSALRQAETFLSDAWARFGMSYRRVQLLNGTGLPILTLGSTEEGVGGVSPETSYPSPTARLRVSIRDLESGEEMGTLAADVFLRAVLPLEVLESAFGRSGYSAVLDWEGGVVLHHPSHRFLRQPVSTLLGSEAWDLSPEMLESERGSFRFRESDSTRVASFVSLAAPPWTVVSSAAMEEFVPAFRGARQSDLLVALLLVALVSGVFLVTTRRTTASLRALTDASERVGKGDLDPPLPSPGPDEVGKLSAAFGLMVGQVRTMVRRVEETRQLAVMGELASNVSHQIRNPLTSIKLNLQGLAEEAEAEGMSETSARSLKICLREVAHLEEAVRKMRELARTHPPQRLETSLHEVVREAVELLRSQMDARGVTVVLGLEASRDRVLADPEELKSVFVHLLVNAEEAMEEAGTIHVSTDNPTGAEKGNMIQVRVRDEGPGVPKEIREQIFRPFVTTKKDGTGFGLAVARLTIQEHGGRILLESSGEEPNGAGEGRVERTAPVREGKRVPGRQGANFLVELPLCATSRTSVVGRAVEGVRESEETSSAKGRGP
jgi:signal transduction histidine kinase